MGISIVVSMRRREIAVELDQRKKYYPEEKVPLEFSLERPFFLFPGLLASFQFDLYDLGNGERLGNYKLPLQIGETGNGSFTGYCSFLRHGSFQMQKIQVLIEDFLGFIRVRFLIPLGIKISISSVWSEGGALPATCSFDGKLLIRSRVRRASGDFFDLRKYFPGDDLRRLNWNLFAHTGELYLREVEKNPPDQGKMTILFAPYSSDQKEYEWVSSLFFTTIQRLIEQGIQLALYFPSAKRSFIVREAADMVSFCSFFDSSYLPYPEEFVDQFQKLTSFSLLADLCFCSMEEYLRFPVFGEKGNKTWEDTHFIVGFIDSKKQEKERRPLFYRSVQSDSLIRDYLSLSQKIRRRKEKERKYLNTERVRWNHRIQLVRG